MPLGTARVPPNNVTQGVTGCITTRSVGMINLWTVCMSFDKNGSCP